MNGKAQTFWKIFSDVQITTAAMWKLCLPSSLADFSIARRPHYVEWRPDLPERFAVGMQMCRKYGGLVPWTQLNVTDIIRL